MSSITRLVRGRFRVFFIAVIAAALAGAVTGSVAAGPPALSKGPIPDDAFRSDGTVDAARVPDFVSVAGPTARSPAT